MKRTFTKYPNNVYASYLAKKSEYSILVLTPDWEPPKDAKIFKLAIDNKLHDLTRDLKELPEVRSIRPAKIVSDEEDTIIELPILFNVPKISSDLWDTIRSIAWDNVFLAEEI